MHTSIDDAVLHCSWSRNGWAESRVLLYLCAVRELPCVDFLQLLGDCRLRPSCPVAVGIAAMRRGRRDNGMRLNGCDRRVSGSLYGDGVACLVGRRMLVGVGAAPGLFLSDRL